ncbi:hypothetical protein FHX14_004803 [Rhizobium sp. BK619]|uniref:Uncharacterized protein n=2 Tax=Rhizobium TaxID=379 RepID=A0AAE5WMI3_9HYPH|nr:MULTISPECIES: hypothetical protein [Rhizobium]MBB3648576.1 hypothetical protein [Rhizobium sp. BK619]MBB6219960.1 hypothetical protein [Rhizobium leguminosarum]QAS77208.1 hypothetical protein CO657_03480 [Rhizobium acidisoli]
MPYRLVFTQFLRKPLCALLGIAPDFPVLALCPENRLQIRQYAHLTAHVSAEASGCVETTSNASHRKEHHPNGVQAAKKPTFFGAYEISGKSAGLFSNFRPSA